MSTFASDSLAAKLPAHDIDTIVVGGMRIAALTRHDAAHHLLSSARNHRRGYRPLLFTSVNGEVLARTSVDKDMAALFDSADQVVADGQPMVMASRFVCRRPLPERVATTDLFHDVAALAQETGQTFYFFGSTQQEVTRAVFTVRTAYPDLKIVGYAHGYLKGEALTKKLAEINALAPDVLWLALGVPREQAFARERGSELSQVGVIKTAGGLFNFLSGTRRRAPTWMQRLGLEWAFRLALEPSRLIWRYLTTNPVALFLILTRSR